MLISTEKKEKHKMEEKVTEAMSGRIEDENQEKVPKIDLEARSSALENNSAVYFHVLVIHLQ